MNARSIGLGWVLGGALVVVGCSGNENDDLGANELDGGGNIDNDAASGEGNRDAALVGEGDGLDASAGNDGSLPASDAGDAAVSPFTSFRVTVLTTPEVPLPGVRVLFHDATGATVGDPYTTDAKGQVTADQAPSSVTVVIQDAAYGARLVTYFATENGDDLIVRVPPNSSNAEPDRWLSLKLPTPLPEFTDSAAAVAARGYYVSVNDAPEPDGGIEIPLLASQVRSHNAVLASTFDSDAFFLGYAYASDVRPPELGESLGVSLGGWEKDPYRISISGAPAGSSSSGAGLYMVAGGFPYAAVRPDDFSYNLLTGEFAEYSFSHSFADPLEIVAFTRESGGREWHDIDQIVRVPTPTPDGQGPVPSKELDFDLPQLENVLMDGVDGSLGVGWSLVNDSPFDTADVQFGEFQWQQDATDGTVDVSWLVVLPPERTSFVFPFVSGLPQVGDVMVSSESYYVVSAVDDSSVASYSEYKQQIVDLTPEAGGHGLRAPLPLYFTAKGQAGSIRATTVALLSE